MKSRTKTCRLKTERGNVHRTWDSAAAHAAKVRRRGRTLLSAYVQPYRCVVCGKFHVGKPKKEVRSG